MTHPTLHQRSIVIDGACPLLYKKRYLEFYRAGGATAVAPTVSALGGGALEALKKLGEVTRWLREDPTLMLMRRGGDFAEAKRSNRLGIVLHFQGGDAIENQLDYID